LKIGKCAFSPHPCCAALINYSHRTSAGS
jgi:hypothetical protein